jgi:membrane protease YdiL (CAAX protease family)
LVTRREILGSLLFIALLMGGLLLLVGVITPFLQLPSLSITLLVTTFEAALLLPPWLIIIRGHRGSWSHLGFRRFHPAYLLLAGGLLLVSFIINLLWSLLLVPFGLETQPEVLPIFGGGSQGLILALVAGGLITPLAEETFFRGFLFANLREYHGPLRAMVTTALLFALFHFTPTAFVPLFFLGCFLALLYHLSESLLPSILLHAAMNTLAFALSYLVERLGPFA